MATFNASSRDGLLSALSSAKGGDAIVVGAGSYGAVTIDHDYSSMVTIRSAAPLAAKFTSITFSGASNVRVDGVHVDNHTNGGPTTSLVRVTPGSHGIQVMNSELNGLVDGNYRGHIGIYVEKTSDILLKNNDIHDVYRGMISHGPKHMQVVGNTFSDLGDDSMKFSNVTNVLIENNYSTGPVPLGSHLDFIQVQGTLSSDMVVRGNVLMVDSRTNVQGIFFGTEMARNILVEDNIIHTGMYNGVFFRKGSGITVRDNTLINVADSVHTGTAVSAPAGSIVQNNIVTSYPGRYTGLNNGNLVVQNMDPDRDDYILEYLINADRGLGLKIEDLGVVKGSLAETMGAVSRLKELLGGIITPPSSEAPPTTGSGDDADPVFARRGDMEFGGRVADIIKVEHSAAMAVDTGSLNFEFNPDRVSGRQGLVSKDAAGGGDHVAAWLDGDHLHFRFEDGSKKAVFEAAGIRANQNYEVLATFSDNQVSFYLGDKLIGQQVLSVDLDTNDLPLQIGGWDGPAGGIDDPYDGTISDVFLFDQVLTPADLI